MSPLACGRHRGQRFASAGRISRGRPGAQCQASAAFTSKRPEMNPPYNVVITGSTKGVGRALAEGFLREGDRVVVCSRTGEAVDAAVAELQQAYGSAAVKGVPCNVARGEDVKQLVEFARSELGQIDMWINNAGTNAYKYNLLADTADEDLVSIVETNVLGVMLCCREAIRAMKEQPLGGHIFNMDGAGADGTPTPRFAAYGATKRSLAQLGKSLAAELKLLKIDNVGIHNLSPGMVTTELLMAGANTPTAKFFINCLAEEAQDVAEYLVPRVRAVPQQSRTLTGGISSQYIQYLTKPKAYSQIFQRLLTGARKNRFVPED